MAELLHLPVVVAALRAAVENRFSCAEWGCGVVFGSPRWAPAQLFFAVAAATRSCEVRHGLRLPRRVLVLVRLPCAGANRFYSARGVTALYDCACPVVVAPPVAVATRRFDVQRKTLVVYFCRHAANLGAPASCCSLDFARQQTVVCFLFSSALILHRVGALPFAVANRSCDLFLVQQRPVLSPCCCLRAAALAAAGETARSRSSDGASRPVPVVHQVESAVARDPRAAAPLVDAAHF